MSAEYEIDMSIPSASEVQQEQQQQQQQVLTLKEVKEYLPHLEAADLLELQDAINTLLKKKWKSSAGKVSKPKEVKPKKPASKALLRTQAWIPYVLKHCTENGWESYSHQQKTKNKETGEQVIKVTERSGSTPNETYIYKDAKTGEIVTPAHVFEDTRKHMTYKDAMILIAILKWKGGVKPTTEFASEEEEKEHWSDLYLQFLEKWDANVPSAPSDSDSDASSSSSSSSSSPKVIRMTAKEREEEREEKRRIAEEEKEQKRKAKEEEKAEREAQKQREKEEKEAKKQREKEEKEAKKQQEKEEKEAQKQREKEEKEAQKAKKSPIPAAAVVKKSPVPAAKPATTTTTKTLVPAKSTTATPATAAAPAAPAPATAPAAATATATAVAAKPAPKQLKKKEEKKEEEKIVWNIPDDGMCHKWIFKGQTYAVNSQMGVWKMESDGHPSTWVGMVDLEKNCIDETVAEPEYDDEEDEQDE